MSMQDWDEELSRVAAEAQRLAAASAEVRKVRRRTLVSSQMRCDQAQIRLALAFERISRLVTKDLLLLPRERAVIHWGRIYAERATAHMEMLGKVLSKNLWLKLVRVRAGGLIEGDDLVGLSVRQANSAKTERYLEEALKSLRSSRASLVASYHELAVEKANKEAAACMAGRLGLTPEDAAQSPTSAALTSFFMHLTAGVRGDAAARRFFDLHERYASRTQNLMSLCRSVLLGRTKDPSHVPSPKALSRFQSSLRQLGDLESGVRAAYGTIVQDAAPPVRLVFVKPPNANANPSKNG